MAKEWHVSNNDYFLRDTSSSINPLTPGVYDVRQSMQGLYLHRLSDKFEFDFKIYGMESKFINKVMTTWHNTTGSLGVILNGVKGTGKTITAEIVANKTELPIILVGTNYPGLVAFLSEIQQDITIVIDEYEKVFKSNDFGLYDDEDDEEGSKKSGGDTTLLGLMDGTYKTSYRKLFLLTTNKMWINENMINRPGRVRYIRKFEDLELSQIKEIVEDCLLDKKFTEDILLYLKKLKLITVDIVKAVISEVNIFNEPPEECCKDLNIKLKEVEYTVIKLPKTGKKEEILHSRVDQSVLQQLITGRLRVGNYLSIEDNDYYIAEKPDHRSGIYVVNETGHHGPHKDNFKIKIKKESGTHRSFMF